NKAIPQRIAQSLLRGGQGRTVASTWARWNRELFADMFGLLLGGPSFVTSLMDVVGRSPRATLHYVPGKPHPTPYLRAFVSIELLKRMGFRTEAESLRRMWTRLYPNSRAGTIPEPLLDTFPDAHKMVVDAVCYQPISELGDKSLAEVLPFDS